MSNPTKIVTVRGKEPHEGCQCWVSMWNSTIHGEKGGKLLVGGPGLGFGGPRERLWVKKTDIVCEVTL